MSRSRRRLEVRWRVFLSCLRRRLRSRRECPVSWGVSGLGDGAKILIPLVSGAAAPGLLAYRPDKGNDK